jgi:hypothetical protein
MTDSTTDDEVTEKILDGDPEPDARGEMIQSVDRAIAEVERKIESGRIRDSEREKVRIKRKRALGYLLRTKRKILRDKELEEMWEIIEDLKEELDDDT